MSLLSWIKRWRQKQKWSALLCDTCGQYKPIALIDFNLLKYYCESCSAPERERLFGLAKDRRRVTDRRQEPGR